MMMLRLRRRKVPSSRQDEREKEMKVVLAELFFFFLPFLPRFSLSFVVRIRYPAVVGAKKQGQGLALGKRVVPRLRELASRGQRELGGGIDAT